MHGPVVKSKKQTRNRNKNKQTKAKFFSDPPIFDVRPIKQKKKNPPANKEATPVRRTAHTSILAQIEKK